MTEQNAKDTLNPAARGPDGPACAGLPVTAVPEASLAADLALTALARRPVRARPAGLGFPGAPMAQIGALPPRAGTPAASSPVVRPQPAAAPAPAEPLNEVQPGESDSAPAAASRPSPAGESGGSPGHDPQNPGQILEDWFATPQGAYVLQWELARIDAAAADIFGYYAVQIGLPGIDFLRANRITSRLTASLAGSPSVHADAHELPFASESLDLVVLPHLLEFSSEPHQILREVERVLRPEGQVIIFAFNPISLWGLRHMFRHTPLVPWSGEFVSVLRLKDWLKLLNFEMRGGRYGCYRPPYTSEKWLSRFGFLEKAGDRWWPVAGAVYMMQAIKRVQGMRVITPAWRKQRNAEALAASPNGVNRGIRRGINPDDLGRLQLTHAPRFVVNPVHTNPQKKIIKE